MVINNTLETHNIDRKSSKEKQCALTGNQNHKIISSSHSSTYVALQLVGLLGVFDVKLLGVAGVLVQPLAVGVVAGLRLALLGLQELRLVGVQLELRAHLVELLLVLGVALELAHGQRVHHLGVVLHAQQPHLLALALHERLFVAELERVRGRHFMNAGLSLLTSS